MEGLNIIDFSILALVAIAILIHFRHGIFALLNRLFSLIVGVALILFILVFIPIWPSIQRPIEESQVGGFLVAQVVTVENQFNRVFGDVTKEAISFLTVAPEEEGPVSLPFKPSNLNVDEESEEEMLELVNDERLKLGLAPLILDESLVRVARAHSFDMWRRQYFAHDNPDGETPFDRMEEGGAIFRRGGENLALSRSVERAHTGLMNSPGHKRNILDPAFGRIGIGVVDGGIYGKMFTQNFAD